MSSDKCVEKGIKALQGGSDDGWILNMSSLLDGVAQALATRRVSGEGS